MIVVAGVRCQESWKLLGLFGLCGQKIINLYANVSVVCCKLVVRFDLRHLFFLDYHFFLSLDPNIDFVQVATSSI